MSSNPNKANARCIFCNKLLRYTHTDSIYFVYKCDFCIKSFMHHKYSSEWLFLENLPWEKNYGIWVVCTIEINKDMKECVEFT